MSAQSQSLTIVIPALNEEDAIGSTIERCLEARDAICDDAGIAEVEIIVVSDGSTQPYRMRVRPPSFVNLGALDKMCRGALIADVVAIIGTLDIVLGEVDR